MLLVFIKFYLFVLQDILVLFFVWSLFWPRSMWLICSAVDILSYFPSNIPKIDHDVCPGAQKTVKQERNFSEGGWHCHCIWQCFSCCPWTQIKGLESIDSDLWISLCLRLTMVCFTIGGGLDCLCGEAWVLFWCCSRWVHNKWWGITLLL